MVYDAYKSCLAGSVRAEQTVDLTARHGYRHVVERAMLGEVFDDVFCSEYIIHSKWWFGSQASYI